MKHIIITGGTRGIGFGLVNEFLSRGIRVTFTGRSDKTVNEAVEKLSANHDSSRFRGVVCDVTLPDDLKTVWDFSTSIFGTVDIWFNNAGIANRNELFHKLNSDDFTSVVDTNIRGLMLATHMAYNRMTEQGFGAIYNMGGLGSDGRMIKGMTPYGMSKKAVKYFTDAFAREVDGEDIIIGLVLPGMVLTDMLLEPIRKDPAGTRREARVFNLLAEEVSIVCGFITDRVVENKKNGTTISYLTTWKMISLFFSRFFSGRNIVK
jgi:NAD(P)-dependent dehydrogenase (short-subunit alcohol dehydrogenase family)